MNTTDSLQVQSAPESKQDFENNPFYVATNGLDLLFKKALSIGVLFAIVSALSVFSGIPSAFAPKSDDRYTQTTNRSAEADATSFMNAIANVSLETWLFIALVISVMVAFITLVTVVFKGISDVTSASIAQGKAIGISDALREVFKNFWGYLWVIIVTNVKIFLWTLLLIIPGIIMAVRYSLSGVVYFDKKLKGNESVKESARLTKGVLLTTMASQNLLNIITLGFITPLLSPGTNAVLYRQYTTATGTKPKAHLLSWITLIVPIVIGVILLFFLFWAAVNYQQIR